MSDGTQSRWKKWYGLRPQFVKWALGAVVCGLLLWLKAPFSYWIVASLAIWVIDLSAKHGFSDRKRDPMNQPNSNPID